jgi:hypothetical protein
LAFFGFSLTLFAETEGLAISGSFSSQNIKMVAGERFEPLDVNIIIFNNYDAVADIKLNASVLDLEGEEVEGIIFDLDFDEIIYIPANDTFSFPVSFTVSELMLPGKYTVTIGAEVIPNQERGIIAVPGVRQRANLEIFGEAGSVNIRFIDVFDNPFIGQVTVRRDDNGSKSIVASFSGSSYEDRLVPGTYEVIVTYRYNELDYDVLFETFTLENNDILDLVYIVETVFESNLNLTPILDENGVLLNASINFSITNVFEVYENVQLRANVYYNGVFLETIIIQNISRLDLGTVSYRYNYAPVGGWQNGTYVFELSVVQTGTEEVLIRASEPYSIYIDSIPGEALPIWVIIVASSIVITFIMSFIFVLRKKQTDKDIICLDDDPEYLKALSKLIEGGDNK